ncbi:chorismate-binding protein [bacterium SCSIO 12741]|nr:chorismate-binding protein [bacterium SCSIO 12741]
MSRYLEVPFQDDPFRLFQALDQLYPKAFVYVAELEGEIWAAATPELFLNRDKQEVQTYALAGTLPVDSIEPWNEKTKHEQQIVTDYISKLWAEEGISPIQCDGPNTHEAGAVKHLLTMLRGQSPINWSASRLVQRMHPTPAVCGEPLLESQKWIEQHEGYDRSFYTGVVGSISPENWKLFVNLRCLRIKNNIARIYVGGGLTAESELQSEWRETEHKSRTLLSVMENL